jgi:hypothetical protein
MYSWEGKEIPEKIRDKAELKIFNMDKLSMEDQEYVAKIVKSFEANYKGRKPNEKKNISP